MSRTALDGFPLKDIEKDFMLDLIRRYIYEAGALDHPGKGQARVIDNDMVEHERENGFGLNRMRRFRYSNKTIEEIKISGSYSIECRARSLSPSPLRR